MDYQPPYWGLDQQSYLGGRNLPAPLYMLQTRKQGLRADACKESVCRRIDDWLVCINDGMPDMAHEVRIRPKSIQAARLKRLGKGLVYYMSDR
jgi:hypothetical protein